MGSRYPKANTRKNIPTMTMIFEMVTIRLFTGSPPRLISKRQTKKPKQANAIHKQIMKRTITSFLAFLRSSSILYASLQHGSCNLLPGRLYLFLVITVQITTAKIIDPEIKIFNIFHTDFFHSFSPSERFGQSISNVHSFAPFVIVSIIFTETGFPNTPENKCSNHPAEH